MEAGIRPRVLIVGGGVMGGAAAYAAARSDRCSVLLLEAGNPFKSSWGESRIARLSQSSGLYLRMMMRSRALWTDLEAEAQARLLKPTGMLDIGSDDLLEPLLRSYDECAVPYQRLDPAQVQQRWPGLRLVAHENAVFQEDGWLVLAAQALEGLCECSRAHGAIWVENDAVRSINRSLKTVTTESGAVHSYDKLILCCGPWTNQVLALAELPELPLLVTNEQQTYYRTSAGHEQDYDWEHLPCIIDRSANGIYVLPHVIGGVSGVKISQYRSGPALDTEEHRLPAGWSPGGLWGGDPWQLGHPQSRADVSATKPAVAHDMSAELDQAAADACTHWAAQHMPLIQAGGPEHHYRCMYTTPVCDHKFVIGEHPQDKDVLLACAGCGEGFKFGMVIGEAIVDLALGTCVEKVPGMRASFSLHRPTLQGVHAPRNS